MSEQVLTTIEFSISIVGEVTEPRRLVQESLDRISGRPTREVTIDRMRFVRGAFFLQSELRNSLGTDPPDLESLNDDYIRANIDEIEDGIRAVASSLSLSLWNDTDQAAYLAAVCRDRGDEVRRHVERFLDGTDSRVVASHMAIEPGSIVLTGVVVVLSTLAKAAAEGVREAVKRRTEAAVERGLSATFDAWTGQAPLRAVRMARPSTSVAIEQIGWEADAPAASNSALAGRQLAPEPQIVASRSSGRRMIIAIAIALLALLALILLVLFSANFEIRHRDGAQTSDRPTPSAISTTSTTSS